MATDNSASQKSKDETDLEGLDISYVAAMFDDVASAKAAYGALRDLKREGMLKIIAAAYLEKTDRSKVKIHEYKDWRGGEGALAGAAVGGVVGIIGSAILLPVAVGALLGGVLAKVHDTRLNDKDLGKLADSLPPGTSALVAIVEDSFVEAVEKELSDKGGKKVHNNEIPKSTLTSMEEKASR